MGQRGVAVESETLDSRGGKLRAARRDVVTAVGALEVERELGEAAARGIKYRV